MFGQSSRCIAGFLVFGIVALADTVLVTNYGSSVTAWNGPSGASLGAFAAQGSDAAGITLGSDGDIYTTDDQNNNVYRYTANGTPLGLFASGPGGIAPFSFNDLVFAPNGDLYVAANDRIVWYDSSGNLAGSFSLAELHSPVPAAAVDVAFTNAGSLLVTEFQNERVTLRNPTTGAILATSSSLGQVSNLAIGADGNVYVSDTSSGLIRVLDPTTLTEIRQFSDPNGPRDLMFSSTGELWVANQDAGDVTRYDPTTGLALGSFAVSTGAIDLISDPGFISTPEPSQIILLSIATFGLVVTARLKKRAPAARRCQSRCVPRSL